MTLNNEIEFCFVFSREVQSLITPTDSTPSPQYTHLMTVIESIRQKTKDLETIWDKRRIRVEFFVQLKHFEVHSREVRRKGISIRLILTSTHVADLSIKETRTRMRQKYHQFGKLLA